LGVVFPAGSTIALFVSTLSSTSTLANVQDAYDDNASYLEDNSVTKARAFVTACLFLLRMQAKRSKHGPAEEELDTEGTREQLKHARIWLATHDTARRGPNATSLSLEDYR